MVPLYIVPFAVGNCLGRCCSAASTGRALRQAVLDGRIERSGPDRFALGAAERERV